MTERKNRPCKAIHHLSVPIAVFLHCFDAFLPTVSQDRKCIQFIFEGFLVLFTQPSRRKQNKNI